MTTPKTPLTASEQAERDDQAEVLQACKQRPRAKLATPFHEVCRDIVENGARRYRGVLIDSYSASAYLAVYDKLTPVTKDILAAKAEKSIASAMSVVWKLCR